MSGSVTDRAREVRARLDAESKKASGYQDVQRLLIRYATERFLYRLGKSTYRDKFVLKGAMLLAHYLPDETRTTRDADFLLYGRFTHETLKHLLQQVCEMLYDDGLVFRTEEIRVNDAGADREYPGYSVTIPTRLDLSVCDIKLDIGFGEAVTPRPHLIDYPALLGFPKPRLRVYPLETVIAEKFEAMVKLGMSNTRLKDYHDLAQIASDCKVDGDELSRALTATFQRRQTTLSNEVAKGLSETFYGSKDKNKEWIAFLKRQGLKKGASLEDACAEINAFLMPVVQACIQGEEFPYLWTEGAWSKKPS